jgi:hypothetical protein
MRERTPSLKPESPFPHIDREEVLVELTKFYDEVVEQVEQVGFAETVPSLESAARSYMTVYKGEGNEKGTKDITFHLEAGWINTQLAILHHSESDFAQIGFEYGKAAIEHYDEVGDLVSADRPSISDKIILEHSYGQQAWLAEVFGERGVAAKHEQIRESVQEEIETALTPTDGIWDKFPDDYLLDGRSIN